MARILLVSHDGWRTGAPYLLLWLAQWLATHRQHELEAFFVRDGPLREEFAAICPTGFWAPAPPRRLHRRLLDRLLHHDDAPGALLRQTITRFRPDLVYLNSLVLGQHLLGLREDFPDTRFLSHVHELEHSLAISSQPDAVRRQIDLSDRLIACADCIRENLIRRHDVPPQRLMLVREFLPYRNAEEFASAPRPTQDSASLLARLDDERRRGTFVFGFTGSPIARKGFDLFPLLVRACAERFADHPFLAVWVGCGPGSVPHGLAMHDLQRLGLEDCVLLHGSVASAVPAIGRFSAVSLLSREDPYPVVCLEGAALGVPSVCFEQAGGIPEFVAGGCGVAVPYLDLQAFAAALHDLALHPERRERLGEAARERVFRESSIDVAGGAISAVMEELISSGSSAPLPLP
ncbi:glycosyltransferase family 4 protein [Cyanobium sp. FGCU-6]|jgi:glycosyltransferase involved in cell wall biosynthesis|nr:glycosyltransferase family 4 protein [Cyanobium sp. FGCU6]